MHPGLSENSNPNLRPLTHDETCALIDRSRTTYGDNVTDTELQELIGNDGIGDFSRVECANEEAIRLQAIKLEVPAFGHVPVDKPDGVF